MKGKFLFIAMLTIFCMGYFLTGCEEDTPSVCDDYCGTVQECSQLNGTWFSISRCERDCEDEREGYALMDCDEPFLDLRECQAELSCASLGDVGDKCAGEINMFNVCAD